MPILQVGLNYPIIIEPNAQDAWAFLPKLCESDQVLVVTNETIAPLYLDRFKPYLDVSQTDTLILPDGEAYKTLATFETILDTLVAKGHRRNTTLIALGGGVIGDMVGFAAACYQRGVSFIQCPTSLLAMVDSSVGGKTAVNHRDGKNLIGAFHQPVGVVMALDVLATLPANEFSAGLAEVIKAALIADHDFFTWLSLHMGAILEREDDALMHMIERSVAIKAAIVCEDERERGRRALLNLGHTFAHAIETATEYKKYLHGEAVAIGLVASARLSQHLGHISPQDVDKISEVLQKAQLPTTLPPDITADDLIPAMRRDKKNVSSAVRFVILTSLGNASLATPEEDLASLLSKCLF